MTRVTINKWGDDPAVRLPGDVVPSSPLQNGARVDIFAAGRDVVIRQPDAEAEVATWINGKSRDEWHAEYSAAAIDWGLDVGKEVVPEGTPDLSSHLLDV